MYYGYIPSYVSLLEVQEKSISKGVGRLKQKEPMLFINGWRFLTIGFLIHLWIIGESTNGSFILILLLLIVTSLRWRFALPIWFVLLDVFYLFFCSPHIQILAIML